VKRVLAAALLGLIACSATGRASSLKTDVGDFARYMRWGMIEKAADLVPAARRISFIAQKRAAQASMVIHEYDITAVEPDATGEHARVLIQATWSRQNDPVMRTELMEQTWEWSERRWLMIEQKPVAADAPTTPDQGL
jgi:hypothetical protein